MTIAQLKKALEMFEDDSYVLVFCPDNSTLYDVVDITDNNGNLQLEVG